MENQDYRHFNKKQSKGQMIASMTEVVYRRYKRLLDENQPCQSNHHRWWKGQLSSALKVLMNWDCEVK
jgi:excinuclease ABC subunit C